MEVGEDLVCEYNRVYPILFHLRMPGVFFCTPLLSDVDSRQSAKIDDRRALSQLVTRNCAFRPNFRQHCKSKGCPVYFYASKLLSVLVLRAFLLGTFGNKQKLLFTKFKNIQVP